MFGQGSDGAHGHVDSDCSENLSHCDSIGTLQDDRDPECMSDGASIDSNGGGRDGPAIAVDPCGLDVPSDWLLDNAGEDQESGGGGSISSGEKRSRQLKQLQLG